MHIAFIEIVSVSLATPYVRLSIFSVRAVSRELQQANLITSEECKMLRDISDVVKVLNSKSSEDVAKTADALKRLGLDNESRFLSGEFLFSYISILQACL